jgi:hypothetical protein
MKQGEKDKRIDNLKEANVYWEVLFCQAQAHTSAPGDK